MPKKMITAYRKDVSLLISERGIWKRGGHGRNLIIHTRGCEHSQGREVR